MHARLKLSPPTPKLYACKSRVLTDTRARCRQRALQQHNPGGSIVAASVPVTATTCGIRLGGYAPAQKQAPRACSSCCRDAASPCQRAGADVGSDAWWSSNRLGVWCWCSSKAAQCMRVPGEPTRSYARTGPLEAGFRMVASSVGVSLAPCWVALHLVHRCRRLLARRNL